MRREGWLLALLALQGACAGARGPITLRFAWTPGDRAVIEQTSTVVEPCVGAAEAQEGLVRDLVVTGRPGALVVEGGPLRDPACDRGGCGPRDALDALTAGYRRPFRARLGADGLWRGHVDPEAWRRSLEAAFAEAEALVEALPPAQRALEGGRLRDRRAAVLGYRGDHGDALWYDALFSLAAYGPFVPGRPVDVPGRLLGHPSRVDVVPRVRCEADARRTRCVLVREVLTWREEVGAATYDATHTLQWTVEPDTLRLWHFERRHHAVLTFAGGACPEDLAEVASWTWAR